MIVAAAEPGSHTPPSSAGKVRASMLRNRQIGSYLFAAALAFAVLWPIAQYYSSAFANGGQALKDLFDLPGIGTTIRNTFVLAAGSTIIGAVLALALAKAVLHVPRRWRTFASLVPLLPLVIPATAAITGYVFVFSPEVGYGNTLLRKLPFFSDLDSGPFNIYSMPAIILITGLDLSAIIFTFVYARLREIRGPLEAAAKLAGASGWKSFMTITLPLLRPSLVAGTVVAFLLGLGQFTAPLLLGTRPGIEVISTEIFRAREVFPIDYALTAALGLPLLIVGILSIVFQRVAVGDQRRYVTQTGGGGGITERSTVWSLVFIFIYAFFAVVLPIAAIILVAFSPFWNGDLASMEFTMRHVQEGLANPQISSAILTSLGTSFTAALIALPLGFFAALALTGPFRAPRPVQWLLDVCFLAPLAVPRAVLGLVVLYVFLAPPFNLYGTYALFVIGYVFIALPFSLRAQHGSLIGVSGSLFEAARISGASRMRIIKDIALPLARAGIIAGATMMMVVLTHDFAVSVMVRSPGNNVMASLLYQYYDNGVYPQVAFMALVMIVITAAGLGLTLWIGGRSALERV